MQGHSVQEESTVEITMEIPEEEACRSLESGEKRLNSTGQILLYLV